MKITLEKTIKVTEALEIEFPIFRDTGDSGEHGGWETFYRIEESGTYFVVTKRYSFSSSSAVEYEFISGKMELKKDLAGYLSYGTRATEQEFNTLLEEARKNLSAFPATSIQNGSSGVVDAR